MKKVMYFLKVDAQYRETLHVLHNDLQKVIQEA